MGSEDETKPLVASLAKHRGSHPNGDEADKADRKPRTKISISEKLYDPVKRRKVLRTLWVGASFLALVGSPF